MHGPACEILTTSSNQISLACKPTQQCSSSSSSTHCASPDPQQCFVIRASKCKQQRRTAARWQEAMQLEM